MTDPTSSSRRAFLKKSGLTGTALAFPNLLIGQNVGKERLRVALIGTGGIGGSHISMVEKNQDVVPCYCDVDKRHWEGAAKRWPQAKAYQDYREMFAKEANNFDAVMIGVPDHHHYPATALAIKAGKHCYTQKPLTHTVWEARQLQLAARKNNLVTQMGNQGHANEGNRLMYEWIHSGALGEIKEIHCFTNRPVWPQPVERPEGEDPVPPELNWDCWIGAAQMRPFKDSWDAPGGDGQGRRRRGQNSGNVYHSFNWRGWWDFGTGALGDMACHTMDCVFWAMNPGSPQYVELISRGATTPESFPKSAVLRWHYAANDKRPALDVYWYEGGMFPAMPDFLESDKRLPNTGVLFIGSKCGILSSGDYGESPRIIPETKRLEIGKPPQLLDRSPGHYEEWQMACMGKKPKDFAKSNFEYAAMVTENILLGNLAIRMGRRIDWDGPNLKVTNLPEANALINKEYRDGWKFILDV